MFLIKRGGDLLAPQLLRRPSGLNMDFFFFLFYHVLHSTHKSSYKYVLHMFPINFIGIECVRCTDLVEELIGSVPTNKLKGLHLTIINKVWKPLPLHS